MLFSALPLSVAYKWLILFGGGDAAMRPMSNYFDRLFLFITLYVSFGQGSSLLGTHTLRPLYSRPIALTQEGRSQVDDVCECMCD